MKKRLSDFTLTTKWSHKIIGWARRGNMPIDDVMQEAYLLELVAEHNIPIDLKHREYYFLRCVRNKIFNHSLTWWETKRFDCTIPNLDIIDSLIKVRGFDELFYDQLITHVSFLLSEIDSISAELFMIRINTQKRWNVIRKEYSHLSHRKFYERVTTIKEIVKKEICKV